MLLVEFYPYKLSQLKTALLLALSFVVLPIILKGQQPKLMVPTGHVLSITDVDFSKDGKYMVTVAENEIKYWETETGNLIYNLKGNSYEGFSNNGKTLITTSLKNDSTGLVKFWDLTTGNLIDSIPGITAKVSTDQNLLMLSSGTDSVLIFQTKTKKKLYSLPGSLGAFLNDDKQIFTASVLNDDSGYKIMIWDAVTKKLLHQYNRAGLSGLKKNKIVLQLDSTIEILDLDKGEVLQKFNRAKNKGANNYFLSYKMRFSPDLKLAMFFTADNYVAVIDNENYTLKKTIDLKTNPTDVVFNGDGSTFMVIDQDSSAIAFDTKTLTKKFELKGHHNSINRLSFSEDNKFILTSSYDQTAILWHANNGDFIRIYTGKNKAINESVLSANGKYLAQYIDGNTFLFNTSTAKKIANISGYTPQLSFSNDSKFLIYGKSFFGAEKLPFIAIYETATGSIVFKETKDFWYFVSPDATRIAKIDTAKTVLKVFNLDHEELFSIANQKDKEIEHCTFSKDNQTLAISYQLLLGDKTERKIDIYDLNSKKLKWSYQDKLIYTDFIFSADQNYLIARLAADSVVCLDLKTGQPFYLSYKIDGVKWVNKTITTTPDGKYVSITGAKEILVYNLSTRKKLLDLKVEDGVSMSAIDTDGTLRYGTYTDQLYTYQLESGKLVRKITTNGYATNMANNLLVTSDRTFLHFHQNNKLLYSLVALGATDQVVIDQFGRYDGTEAARKLLYFTCGKEIISLDQVKDLLWVPNLAERITKGEIINAAKISDLAICGLTPEVETIENKTDEYQFKITPRKGGLGETVLYINDIEIKRYSPTQLVKVGVYYELKIPKLSLKPYFVSGKENPVTVKAYTLKNDISSRGAKVTNQKTAASTTAPNLYAVIVGVSDYKGTELDLKYAAKDANDISNALGNSARKLLNTDGKEHVFIYNLNTSAAAQFPEKLSIKNAIADVGKKATANDIFMVFFAGHGVMEGAKKQFYFLTADASQSSLAAQVGISTDELSEWMKPANIKAQKRILIFDACNSGQAVNELVKIGQANQQYVAARNDDKAQQIKTIEKLNEKSGLFILSASASNQSAYEMGRFSQGLLTYALLKTMKEQPDILDDNKFLNVGKWFAAAEKTVTDMVRESGNRQEPQVVSMSNFNIGIVDQDVISKINLPQEKALFASSNFQNSDETIADDDLELSKAINQALNNISSRGAETNISYVIGTNSPDAYALSGRYEVKGNDITVKVNIRKNKEIKYKFELKGKIANLAALAENIVKNAADWSSKNK